MFNAIVGTLAVIVAGVAAFISWSAARRSERAAEAGRKVSALTAAADWQRDVREWAGEAIGVLGEASYRCGFEDEGTEECAATLRDCRIKLSTIIDRGRFFLPNIPNDKIGRSKPSAYRGWRHAALDPLVAAERVLSGHEGHGKFNDREAALIAMRREFVSSIQQILAPQHHNKEIARLISEANEARAHDKTMGGLIPDAESVPTGADRLLHGTPSDEGSKLHR